MKPEKIIEIFKTHKTLSGNIYSEQYPKIASEISTQQDEELKEAIKLLKWVRQKAPTNSILFGKVDKFIHKHE